MIDECVACVQVIRDVLSNQMELLGNIWADEACEIELKRRHEQQAAKDATTNRPK